MYEFIEVLSVKGLEGCIIRQGMFWEVERNDGRLAIGKSREEAIANMLDGLEKERLFNLQWNL